MITQAGAIQLARDLSGPIIKMTPPDEVDAYVGRVARLIMIAVELDEQAQLTPAEETRLAEYES